MYVYINIYIYIYILYLQDVNARLFQWIISLIMTKHKSPEIHIGKSVVKSSGCVKVLGIEIDSKLSKLHFIH